MNDLNLTLYLRKLKNFNKLVLFSRWMLLLIVALIAMEKNAMATDDPPIDTIRASTLVEWLRLNAANPPVVECHEQDYPVFGVDIKIYNLGENINSAYSDYNPVIDKKESFMLFTSRRPISEDEPVDIDGQYFEKMYVSKREGGVFQPASPITEDDSLFGRLPSSERHESLIFLSYSEDLLITYTNEKLYYSNRIGDFYSEPVEFPKVINKGKWKRHASITEDGRKLYFTTESESSINKNLNLDIWEIERNNDGTWKRPKRLTDRINSPYNEDSPEISPDGRFLFFSSNRSGGIGGYDIYMAENVDGEWQEPKNLCRPINTAGDDIYFKLSRNGNYAYYSSNTLGGEGFMDVYKVVLDVPSIATCGSYAYGKRNINFTSPFDIEFYGRNKEFFWSFGDGTSGVGSTLNHQYETDGNYQVVLYVRDKSSQRVVNTVFSKMVRVDTERSVVEILGPDTVLIGDKVQFDGRDSKIDGVPATAYYWKVDGELVSRDPRISHEFARIGQHKIELEVGVLDERVMELSSTCLAREIYVATPFEYQKTVGATEGSKGFTYTALIPDHILYEMGVSMSENELKLKNDYIRTSQGKPVSFGVFENDREPGISLDKVIDVSNAEHGRVILDNANYGLVSYIPNNGFYGYDKFVYTAKSRDGVISSATVVVSVMQLDNFLSGQNIQTDEIVIDNATSVKIYPLQNDQHKLGATQKLISISQPRDGEVRQIGLQGLIEYSPSASFQGEDAFTYTIEDEYGKRNTASVLIKLSSTRQSSVIAHPDHVAIEEGEKARLKILDNDIFSGNTKVVNISTPEHGAAKVINPSSGDLIYSPESGFSGTDAFTYTIEDDKGNRSTSSVTVVVKMKPVINKPLVYETQQNQPINIFLFKELALPDDYQIYGHVKPKNGEAGIVDGENGVIAYQPNDGFVGFDMFSATLKGGSTELIAGIIIKIRQSSALSGKYGVTNNTIAASVNGRTLIDTRAYNYTTLNKQHQVIIISSPEDVARLGPDGKVQFDYSKLGGEQFAINYQTEDENGKLNAGAFLIQPTDDLGIPKVTEMALATDLAKTTINKPITVYPMINDKHLSGRKMTLHDANKPMNGTVVIDSKSGSVLYVPNLDFTGTDAFVYTVIDDAGVKASTAINVVILSEKEAALEERGLNPRLNAFDWMALAADEQRLKPEEITDAGNGLFGKSLLVEGQSGKVQYMPNQGFSGMDRFAFTVKYSNGSTAVQTATAAVEAGSTFMEGERIAEERMIFYNDEPAFYYPLNNRVHPTGSDMQIISVDSERGGITGVIGGRAFAYRALKGFTGADKVTYVVMDENGRLQSNTIYVDVKDGATRTGNYRIEYETPVNIGLNFSLRNIAPTATYVEHSTPTGGSLELESVSNLVFNYKGETVNTTSDFIVTLKNQLGEAEFVHVLIRTTRPVEEVAQDEKPFNGFDYKTLGINESGKMLSSAAADKGLLFNNESEKKFDYQPLARATGADVITYLVMEDGKLVQKQLNVYHVSHNSFSPKSAIAVRATGDDQNKLLIYTFSNMEKEMVGKLTVDKLKKANAGEVRIVDAKRGIIEYTPKKDVLIDQFSYTLVDTDNNKQTVDVNLALATFKAADAAPVEMTTSAEFPLLSHMLLDRLAKDDLKFSGISSPANGEIEMIDFDKGLFRYLPKDGFNGVDYLLVQVTDDKGLVYYIPMSIRVMDKPSVSSPNLTYNNVASMTQNNPAYHAVFGMNDDKLRLTKVQGAKAGFLRILNAEAGIVEYTPYAGFTGEDTYTFEYVNSEGELFRKEMRVYVRDDGSGLVTMRQVMEQSESYEPKLSSVSQEIALAQQESMAALPPNKLSKAQSMALQAQKEKQAALAAKVQADAEAARLAETKEKEAEAQLAAMQRENELKAAEIARNELAEAQRLAQLEADKRTAEANALKAKQEEERRKAEELAMAQKAEAEAAVQREREQALADMKVAEEKKAEEAQALAALKREEERKKQELAAQTAKAKSGVDDAKVVFRNILFDFDKSDLRELSTQELDRIHAFMVANPDAVLQLDGHADWIGTVEYNLALSERRAKQAYDYLIAKGISSHRMMYQFFGEALPVAPNANADGSDNPQGRQLNRRCEFDIKQEGTAEIIMKF